RRRRGPPPGSSAARARFAGWSRAPPLPGEGQGEAAARALHADGNHPALEMPDERHVELTPHAVAVGDEVVLKWSQVLVAKHDQHAFARFHASAGDAVEMAVAAHFGPALAGLREIDLLPPALVDYLVERRRRGGEAEQHEGGDELQQRQRHAASIPAECHAIPS